MWLPFLVRPAQLTVSALRNFCEEIICRYVIGLPSPPSYINYMENRRQRKILA